MVVRIEQSVQVGLDHSVILCRVIRGNDLAVVIRYPQGPNGSIQPYAPRLDLGVGDLSVLLNERRLVQSGGEVDGARPPKP